MSSSTLTLATSAHYLGLDLSTQQLKAVVVDDNLTVLHRASVHFDSDLPEFRTHGGVIIDKNQPSCITTPTLLWIKALDMLMDRLTLAGCDFGQIVALSGTAQQHGSVYWLNGSEKRLSALDPTQFLHQQLAGCFSVTNSPVWMDASTGVQCRMLEEAAGGAQRLAEITGSRAYERFTGVQIAKIAITRPDAYANSERISLISSFLCSIFVGRIAPIDYADASGMNLFNIRTKQYDSALLNACGCELHAKLAEAVPSSTNLGSINAYFIERWGFNQECSVVAFTGDNPSSLAGMRLSDGWLALSLGTSDTIFLWLNEAKTINEGHVFCNPIDSSAYMALLCYKNGSLQREKVRNNCAEGSWDIFNQLLESTPRGNFGNLGFYYSVEEIAPQLQGEFRFNKANERVVKFTSLEVEVRALIEGQFIAKRAHIEDIGYKLDANTRILATGGASTNKSILQVIADVFNAPVYVQDNSDSAMLGAAYRAKHGIQSDVDFATITQHLPEAQPVCQPYVDAEEVYAPMVERYRNLIAEIPANKK